MCNLIPPPHSHELFLSNSCISFSFHFSLRRGAVMCAVCVLGVARREATDRNSVSIQAATRVYLTLPKKTFNCTVVENLSSVSRSDFEFLLSLKRSSTCDLASSRKSTQLQVLKVVTYFFCHEESCFFSMQVLYLLNLNMQQTRLMIVKFTKQIL